MNPIGLCMGIGLQPFDIDRAVELLRTAVEPLPPAAMFELYDEGYTRTFELLVACIISIRTRDETMLPVARQLFSRARTPADMAKLSAAEIDQLIQQSSFHSDKAARIRFIAQYALREHGGDLPCDYGILTSLPGVGPKCANLVLGIACGQPRIGVDIHVHRVTNRWGYVRESSPEVTMRALEQKLPKRYWVEINRLLVPFGKHICTGSRPACSQCLLRLMCQRVGVTTSR